MKTRTWNETTRQPDQVSGLLMLSGRWPGRLSAWLRGVLVSLMILPVFAASAVVSTVSATSGSYKAAQLITITVTFDQAVTVVGAPLLALNLTGAPTATCLAVTNSLTMTCRYTVASTDNVTTLDYAATTSLTLPSGSSITTVSDSSAATLTLPVVGGGAALAASGVRIDTTAPTLPAANIQVDNQASPNTVTLVFSEDMTNNAALTTVSNYALKNSGATITYSIASVTRISATTVRLNLAATDPANVATYITNVDIAAHVSVTLGSTLTDLAGNALVAATVLEASASPAAVRDTTSPTVSSTLEFIDTTRVRLVFSEKINKSKAETVTNYTLSGTSGGIALSGSPTTAVLASNGTDVTLTLPANKGFRTAELFKVTVGTGVLDLPGNALAATTVTLTVSQVPGTLSFTARTNALAKVATDSTPITISGLNAPAAIGVITGSDASLLCSIAPAATGTFGSFATCSPTTSTLLVFNGDQVKVQLLSSTSALSTVTGGITVASTSAEFSITTAPAVSVVGNITFTGLSKITSALSNPNSAVFISANGVLVIPASVTTASVLQAVPANTAISIEAGANLQLSLNGITLNIKPQGANALFLTKSYTVNGTTGVILMELVSGRVIASSSAIIGPMMSLQVGSGTTAKQVLLTNELLSQASFDAQLLPDGQASLAVTGGRINARLASAASVVAVADAATALYANEIASISALGKISQIRLGTLAGNLNVAGDVLAVTLPGNVFSRMRVPNMGRPHDRLDPNVPLMQSLFDFVGSRTTLTQTTQGAHGQIPLLLNGVPLFVIPYGELLVDTTRPDGITLANDGHFEVTRKGVYAKLTTTVSNLTHLATAVQATLAATVSINEDGAFEVNKGGQTVLVKPDITSQTTNSNGFAIRVTETGRMIFQTIGREQILFPKFFDLNQITKTFESLDPKMVLVDNLDGSVTAIVKGASMRLLPEYEILSPIGGIPPEHRNSPFWIDANTGVIYFKYPTGSAQGFRVQ